MPANQAINRFVIDPDGRSYDHPKFLTKADDYTLTLEDSGKVFVMTVADKVFTLPSTVNGLVYTLVTGVLGGSTGLSVSPAAADKLSGGTDDKDFINTAATDILVDWLKVIGNGGDGWWIIGKGGIWAPEA